MEKYLKKTTEVSRKGNVHGPTSITRDNAHVGSGNCNPAINFYELSLDGAGHMIQIGGWLSPSFISTEEKPRNEQSETMKLNS